MSWIHKIMKSKIAYWDGKSKTPPHNPETPLPNKPLTKLGGYDGSCCIHRKKTTHRPLENRGA